MFWGVCKFLGDFWECLGGVFLKRLVKLREIRNIEDLMQFLPGALLRGGQLSGGVPKIKLIHSLNLLKFHSVLNVYLRLKSFFL